MSAIQVTITGNVTHDPELRFTPSGKPVCRFTVAANERYKAADGTWKDGSVSFVTCNAWGGLGENIAESIMRGSAVVVTGTIRQRSYDTKEGDKRTVWEVTASDVAASLRHATVRISKVRRDGAPLPEDPWEHDDTPAAAEVSDQPPF